MKNWSIIKLSAILVVFTLAFSGCAKEEDGPEEEEPGTTLPAAKFTWKVNSGATMTANETFFIAAYNNILGSKTDGSNVDITLDGLSKGTYNISSSSGIFLEYSTGNNTYTGQSGTVVITENTGTLISGTFNCSFGSSSAISTIQGEFSNVQKK